MAEERSFRPLAWLAMQHEGPGRVLDIDRDWVHWEGTKRASYCGISFDAAYRLVPLHEIKDVLRVDEEDLAAAKAAAAADPLDPIAAALNAFVARRAEAADQGTAAKADGCDQPT